MSSACWMILSRVLVTRSDGPATENLFGARVSLSFKLFVMSILGCCPSALEGHLEKMIPNGRGKQVFQ